MFLKHKTVLAATVVAGMLPGSLAAQEEWMLGSVGAPGSALAAMGDMVAEAMTEASDGEFTIERQFIGNEQEMVQQVLRGRVQVGATSSQGLGVVVPEQSVLAFPFLWGSQEEMEYVIANHAKPVLAELMAAQGLQLLAVGDAGFYGVFCRFDCHDPASLEGERVRVSPTPPANLFWEVRGANRVQMPISELWPGLEQNLVSAADIPFPFYLTTPAAESAPHFINTNHFHAPWIFFTSQRTWSGLSEEQQQAIIDGLPSQGELFVEIQRELSAARDRFADMGGHFYEVDAEMDAAWRDGVEERLPELLEDMGSGAARLYQAIQDGKAEFAAQQD
ncbi:MAG: TRAP-type C4-dicarboxylate transport system, periplasmic component [Rhodobacteraceae bacterium HLUCCA12]|nr:MAG: TRAP-type C4-dicarboxylate transport system, periplasmic component [Rhodobacteraceae bacterium HLUCCA12]